MMGYDAVQHCMMRVRCADVGHSRQVDVLTSDDVFFETLRNAAASWRAVETS